MSMELINGIPCFNCTDVERAKKVGLDGPNKADPLHPSSVIQANGDAAPSNGGAGAQAAAHGEASYATPPMISETAAQRSPSQP